MRLRNIQQGSVLRYSRLYAQEMPKFLIGNIEPCGLLTFCDSPSPSNAESRTWKVTPGGPESLSVAFKMWFRPEETANRSLEDVLGPNSTTQDEFKKVSHVELPAYQCGAASTEHRRHACPLRAGSGSGQNTWSVKPCWSFLESVCDSTAEEDLTQPLHSVLEHKSPKRKSRVE